jgi:hypothetical protein
MNRGRGEGEELKSHNDGTASADSAPRRTKADEPGEAPKRKFWSEDGSLKGTTAMAMGLH